MSRREREAKIRAAAPRREAYLAAQAAAAHGGGGGGMSLGWKVLLGVGVLLAIGGALAYALVIEPWLDRRSMLSQSGRPRGAVIGDGVVALFDAVDVEHDDREDPRRNRRIDRTRVTVIDVRTGARVAQHLFAGNGGCASAGPGKLWCDLDGLAVHDARTFASIARADELVAKAGLGHLVGQRWRLERARATWALDDGRAAVIDADALAARAADAVPAELRPHPITGLAPSDGSIPLVPGCNEGPRPFAGRKPTIATRGASWAIEDRGGRAIVRRLGGPAPAEATTFLAPVFLTAVDDAPIVLHHASIDPARDHARISRVGDDGAPTWTVELKRQCLAAVTVEGRLVIATDHPAQRALAIDTRTGRVAWTATGAR